MDDFRVAPGSFFDERPDLGSPGARKRKKQPLRAPGDPASEQDDDQVDLSSEPDATPEEPAGDFYAPSERDTPEPEPEKK